ncbi:MAG: DUF6502 family protein [Gammaproteobacteria bacterium]|nr:DUF6502 family protein [Gammaproteobacteria bacterium]MDH3505762.1 DUF6502 family protein [Gammaproteobacteria bacterium]
MTKTALLKACRHLLVPVVRLLQRSGITWAEFAELGKEVYVAVAGRDYGLQGRPTNASRVAMITGLSRREVTRVRKTLAGVEDPKQPAGSSIAQVLSGWHLDTDFLNAGGHPARLPADGNGASLATLLKRYAGDTPHGALTKELLKLELIAEVEPSVYEVRAREYIRSPLDPDMLRQVGVALHDHGMTLAHNVDSERTEPPRFEGMASNPRVARSHLEDFRKYLDTRGQAFLEEIDAWLSEHQVNETESSTSESVRLGAGVYLIHDETKR